MKDKTLKRCSCTSRGRVQEVFRISDISVKKNGIDTAYLGKGINGINNNSNNNNNNNKLYLTRADT